MQSPETDNYLPAGDIIVAYSHKVASRELLKRYGGFPAKMSQEAALRDKRPVKLYFRHPLERLVSAYAYFITPGRGAVRKRIENYCPQHHQTLLSNTTSFERWVEIAFKYVDEHWIPQVDVHTTPEGIFVPDEVVHVDTLGGSRKNTSKHGPWQNYFYEKEDLLKMVTEYYKEDLALYAKL